jgi:hypothetical protein
VSDRTDPLSAAARALNSGAPLDSFIGALTDESRSALREALGPPPTCGSTFCGAVCSKPAGHALPHNGNGMTWRPAAPARVVAGPDAGPCCGGDPPGCAAENPDPPHYNCTRRLGHAGPHTACGGTHNYATWVDP